MNVYLWEDEVLEVLPGLGEPKYPPVRAEDFHTRITSKYYGDDYAAGPSADPKDSPPAQAAGDRRRSPHLNPGCPNCRQQGRGTHAEWGRTRRSGSGGTRSGHNGA